MFFPEIVSMHFQLTGRCNLKCIFCGQQNGMFEGKNREELPYEKWIAIAEEVRNLGSRPEIILWGGEPLLYSRFDELAEHLHRMGFELGIVTNGTLADRHADLLNNAFKTIYISLDGNAEYHNRIRGNGVFEKVSDNLELLKKRNGHLVFLCTLADENASAATEIAECLSEYHPDKIIFQRLMYFSSQEITEYRNWLNTTFQTDDPTIEVWKRDDDAEYQSILNHALSQLRRDIAAERFPCKIEISSHLAEGAPCLAPFKRIHIKYNGDLLFCTDFYGFVAGNVKQSSIGEIFLGRRAELVRREIEAGRNPLCRHCSWRSNRTFQLD